jgi:hypothetical protein
MGKCGFATLSMLLSGDGRRMASALGPHHNQPLRRKYQNGAITLSTISPMAKG